MEKVPSSLFMHTAHNKYRQSGIQPQVLYRTTVVAQLVHLEKIFCYPNNAHHCLCEITWLNQVITLWNWKQLNFLQGMKSISRNNSNFPFLVSRFPEGQCTIFHVNDCCNKLTPEIWFRNQLHSYRGKPAEDNHTLLRH